MSSLFSFQFLNPNMSQDYVNYLVSSGVTIVKVLDPDKAPWLWPSNVKCLARFHFSNTDDPLVWQGRAGARTWFSWVKPRIAACKAVWAVETPNEVNVFNIADCVKWCDFMDEAAILLHSINIKIVIGNFGVTHPTWTGAGAYLKDGLAKADFLGLHEYKYKSRLSVSMRDEALPTCRWWVFRYMRLVKEIQDSGGRVPPIFMTEFGVDEGGGQDSDGWRATNLGAIGMFNLSVEYETICKQLGYVVGIFSFASHVYSGQWSSFVNDGPLNDLFVAYIKKELTPVTPVQTLIIDGRLMNMVQFDTHVKGIDLSWANTVVIHHTAKPTVADWTACGWECRKENMRLYYQNDVVWYDENGVQQKGWTSGPHLFVSDEGVGLFSTLSKPGTGVVGHNSNTIHIEVVGDYTLSLPVGATYTNMISVAATLLRHMPNTTKLTYHSALQPNTSCPGNGIIYNWHAVETAVYAQVNKVDLSQEQPTATKIRWHTEEAYRELLAYSHVPETDPGMQRLHELIKLDGGLLYRFEALHPV